MPPAVVVKAPSLKPLVVAAEGSLIGEGPEMEASPRAVYWKGPRVGAHPSYRAKYPSNGFNDRDIVQ